MQRNLLSKSIALFFTLLIIRGIESQGTPVLLQKCSSKLPCSAPTPFCFKRYCRSINCYSHKDCKGLLKPYCNAGLCEECQNRDNCPINCKYGFNCPKYQKYCQKSLGKCSWKKCLTNSMCKSKRKPLCNPYAFTCQNYCTDDLYCQKKKWGSFCYNKMCGSVNCTNWSDCSNLGLTTPYCNESGLC